MSKKKRLRKEFREQVKSTEDQLWELRQDALEFFEGASPYEISFELTKLGVSTAHREGIFRVLDADFQRTDPEQLSKRTTHHSDRFLVQYWKKEIEAKKREPSGEDLLFLMIGAMHFALKWSESRVELISKNLADVKAELARREQAVIDA